MVTLTIYYADGTPTETIKAERLDMRVEHCLGYVLPGEKIAHGIPMGRIDHYFVQYSFSTPSSASGEPASFPS